MPEPKEDDDHDDNHDEDQDLKATSDDMMQTK
jgi:hypothetical protein